MQAMYNACHSAWTKWEAFSDQVFEVLIPSRPSLFMENPINNVFNKNWTSVLEALDVNHDGHISYQEWMQLTPQMAFTTSTASTISSTTTSTSTWSVWFRREWYLMDWKLGVFLSRSFGGLLLLLIILSIIPGRLHALTAKVLRWPVLALVYFLIAVQLAVYIVIRVVIRVAEYLVARPKHRQLRRQLQSATSYQEWLTIAKLLDHSQKRHRWLKIDHPPTTTTPIHNNATSNDTTTQRYNWRFIRQLQHELQHARHSQNSVLALAVLQNCTRKNVGGIMSEDLFSYSNSGSPKYIVKEFIHQVVDTVHWLTNEAVAVKTGTNGSDTNVTTTTTLSSTNNNTSKQQAYDALLQKTVREEKNKVWHTIVRATLNVFGEDEEDKANNSSSNQFTLSQPTSLGVHHRTKVLDFLKRARTAYGRTALCLSGGAMMGLYHFGHVRALLESGILPCIISGTSGGSVIGAMVCTRSDKEIVRDFDPKVVGPHLTCFDRSWKARLQSFWKNGSLFSFDEWMEKILWFTNGPMTFQEAYQKTGRIFCVTLSSTTKKAPPVLLNYLTAPNVTIASAVIASAAVPGFVPPVRLQFKDAEGTIRQLQGESYFDGSIEQDIPVNGLAEMFNCQFFIACQCNPHIVPFFYNSKGAVGRPSRWSSGMQEDSWRGGFLLAALEMYLKNDMKAKFRFLHELEAAVGFTSSMMVQEFVGTTTIVPQVSFLDYFRLFSDPTLDELYRYYQAGSVAAYEHTILIKLHYEIADALDECIARLEGDNDDKKKKSRDSQRRSKVVFPVYSKDKETKFPSPTTSDSSRSRCSFSSSSQADLEDSDEDDEIKWIKLE